jgi:hypothetical protein
LEAVTRALDPRYSPIFPGAAARRTCLLRASPDNTKLTTEGLRYSVGFHLGWRRNLVNLDRILSDRDMEEARRGHQERPTFRPS